jgi:hypothetical protein
MTADSLVAFVVMATIIGLLIGLARHAYDLSQRISDLERDVKYTLRDGVEVHIRLNKLEEKLGETVHE